MQKKQTNKTERKIPDFKVTTYIGFFDVYFRTFDNVHLELERWCNNFSLLPTTRTDDCDCRLCTTEKFTYRNSVKDYEVYLSRYQSDEDYSAVARFKKIHSDMIEDLLFCHLEHEEFLIKRIQYVFDFESEMQEDLLELITKSIEIELDSTVYENIHAYVEICEIPNSEPIIRLNIVVNYPNSKTEIGVFRDTESEADQILDHLKFCVFDQNTFFSALANQCMQITESQLESLKEQLQEIANMNGLRRVTSKYVDSKCFKVHQLQSLFEKGIANKEIENDPPSFDTKTVVLNTEPDIIPELEYSLPEYN